MTRIESELQDLCECLMRNDDMADRDTYLTITGIANDVAEVEAENTKLRELFEKTYGYYVSGTLTPCDFCKRLDCEGNAPTTCEADEYDPDGIVNNEIERLMRELGIEGE